MRTTSGFRRCEAERLAVLAVTGSAAIEFGCRAALTDGRSHPTGTPNRWFPIEFRTLLPLVDWLPPEHFRKLLVLTGRDFLPTNEIGICCR
jgi:hypothetical protein